MPYALRGPEFVLGYRQSIKSKLGGLGAAPTSAQIHVRDPHHASVRAPSQARLEAAWPRWADTDE